jgi:transcriptional regulator
MMFEPRCEADILRLVDEYPLAWVVSRGASGFGASPLPLLAETGSNGRIVSLVGHIAIANPQVSELRSFPLATILSTGPHGYVSPELVSKPDWAPTWNYATARFEVEVEFVPEETEQLVERLVRRMERDRRKPWTVLQMGARYAQLAQRIVGFRAHVNAVHGQFKLGQDESHRTLSDILSGLQDAALVRWMKDFNSAFLTHSPKEPT